MISLLLPLLALAAAPPAPPPPASPPVDEARFQRFVRVLPDSPATAAAAPPAADPLEAVRLAKLNPGRERDILALLRADAQCTAPIERAAVLRMMRHVADRLGPEKLDRMIAFYESADLKVLDRLGASGAALSAADEAELARLQSAYPIGDFAAAMEESGKAMWEDAELLDASMKCSAVRDAAFKKAKLRAY